MRQQVISCFRLLRHAVWRAWFFALASAGKSRLARIAMIAMTTRSSMSVKPRARPLTPLCFDLISVFIADTSVRFSHTESAGAQPFLDDRLFSRNNQQSTFHPPHSTRMAGAVPNTAHGHRNHQRGSEPPDARKETELARAGRFCPLF